MLMKQFVINRLTIMRYLNIHISQYANLIHVLMYCKMSCACMCCMMLFLYINTL